MVDASRLTALLGALIALLLTLLAPCAPGASAISVRHRIYEQDHSADDLQRILAQFCFLCAVFLMALPMVNISEPIGSGARERSIGYR